jgi:4-amino-4-deoxy-L-arabinose transferase-like glycosyltransferase
VAAGGLGLRRPALTRVGIARRRIEPLVATALTFVFLAISLVWLALDREVPLFDSGAHLTWTTYYRDHIQSGDLLFPFTYWNTYPPLVHLVGAAGMFIGGIDVAPAVIAQNVVFVPLLALGSYQVGRLVYNRLAGALAVFFALGTPMIGGHFHVYLLDAPEAAMVAVSVWLLLASERFTNRSIAAVAGLACGLGLLVKETFVFFLAGLVAVLIVRGGWRNWRGLVLFFGVAVLVGLPWYFAHFSDLYTHASNVNTARATEGPGSITPSRWSTKNAGWYVWSSLNHQPLAPLLAFAAAGTIWAIVRYLRWPSSRDFTPELVLGGVVSWIGLTLSMPHDARYSLPALVYLAVLGTGWITALPRLPSRIAIAVLVLIAAVNTAGASFGFDTRVALALPGAPSGSLLRERQITLFAPGGHAPRRDGDVLALMRALRRSGVRAVHWDLAAEAIGSNFTHQGLGAYAEMADLQGSVTTDYTSLGPRDAYLLRWPLEGTSQRPPCIRLDEATGVWVRLGNPLARGQYFCPMQRPALYGP